MLGGFVAQQNLRALECFGTVSELTWVLAEVLDKSSQTSEAMAEREQKEHHQKLPSLAHKEPEQTFVRPEASFEEMIRRLAGEGPILSVPLL